MEHDTTVNTIGDIDLQTHTRGVIQVAPNVHTYGLAAAASVHARGIVTNNNQVNVDANANLTAQGQMNLLAGRTADGARNYFDLVVHGDALNAAVIPINSLESHGEVNQNHFINIAAGSHLRSGKDAMLAAERFSNSTIKAYGSGQELADGGRQRDRRHVWFRRRVRGAQRRHGRQ